jgi:hypothetical protein
MLLLVGLWSLFVGALIAVIELWIAVTHVSDPWMSTVLSTIGGTSAMLDQAQFLSMLPCLEEDTWTCKRRCGPRGVLTAATIEKTNIKRCEVRYGFCCSWDECKTPTNVKTYLASDLTHEPSRTAPRLSFL